MQHQVKSNKKKKINCIDIITFYTEFEFKSNYFKPR